MREFSLSIFEQYNTPRLLQVCAKFRRHLRPVSIVSHKSNISRNIEEMSDQNVIFQPVVAYDVDVREFTLSITCSLGDISETLINVITYNETPETRRRIEKR